MKETPDIVPENPRPEAAVPSFEFFQALECLPVCYGIYSNNEVDRAASNHQVFDDWITEEVVHAIPGGKSIDATPCSGLCGCLENRFVQVSRVRIARILHAERKVHAVPSRR
jgi:hypothetical protein